MNSTAGESLIAPAPALQTAAARTLQGSNLWCSLEVAHRDRTESAGGDTVAAGPPPHQGSKFMEPGMPPGSLRHIR